MTSLDAFQQRLADEAEDELTGIDAAASEDLDPAPDRVVMKLKPRMPSEKAEDELNSIDAFQQRLADEAEDELTGIEDASSEDLDPSPELRVMKLKSRTPSTEAL